MITDQHDIIRRPIVTEKTSIQRETNGQVSFEVSKKANRIEITKAVEEVFDVKVARTRTIQVKGKAKRKGRIVGKRRSWKKAIITLVPGESIGFFESA